MVLVQMWHKGWKQPDAGAPNAEEIIENQSIASLLEEYEMHGFTVEMARAGVGRALRGQTVRIDLFEEDGAWKMRKYPYGWTAKTRPIEEKPIDQKTLQAALNWMYGNQWTVREWPGGYRGFRGAPKPVRDRHAIQAMRRNAKIHQSNTRFDFAFDF